MVSANYPLSNKPLFVIPYKEVLSFASEREKSLRVTFHTNQWVWIFLRYYFHEI